MAWGGSFQPTHVLRGALHVRVGALLLPGDRPPTFVQLWVCDANVEREAALWLE